MNRRFCIDITTTRDGAEGWSTEIMIPTSAGHITVAARIPDGSLRALLTGGTVSGIDVVGDLFGTLSRIAGGAILGPPGAMLAGALSDQITDAAKGGGKPAPKQGQPISMAHLLPHPSEVSTVGVVPELLALFEHLGLREQAYEEGYEDAVEDLEGEDPDIELEEEEEEEEEEAHEPRRIIRAFMSPGSRSVPPQPLMGLSHMWPAMRQGLLDPAHAAPILNALSAAVQGTLAAQEANAQVISGADDLLHDSVMLTDAMAGALAKDPAAEMAVRRTMDRSRHDRRWAAASQIVKALLDWHDVEHALDAQAGA
jgi:hypothetical protein